MERDFMGLSQKRMIFDEITDSVRRSTMQWSFSNTGSSVPQPLSSFRGFQEDQRQTKSGFDSLVSTGLVTITTRDAFDSDHKSQSSLIQKSVVPETQGGIRYTVSSYSTRNLDAHKTHIRPVITNQVSSTNHQSLFANATPSSIGSSSPRPIAGSPVINPVQGVRSNSPVVGTTDLRNSSKSSGAPAQLTMFYAGSVCVYDNISPEKAQAIMLLAGNVPSLMCNTTLPSAPVPSTLPKSSFLESFAVNQSYDSSTQRILSPMPISSINRAGVLVSSANKVEPRKIFNSLRSSPTTCLSSGTVPQFRRKSLARFLEKRKERVIDSSPYGENQSGSTSLSVNSSGSCHVRTGK